MRPSTRKWLFALLSLLIGCGAWSRLLPVNAARHRHELAGPTVEHLERGQVLPSCASIEQAQESFGEAVEIADVIVPGRDNIILNPLRQLG